MRTLLSTVLLALSCVAPLAIGQTRSPQVAAVIGDLVAANHILAAKGILPGWGHVSVRHPENPERYFMSRSLAPELVIADDVVEYDLESRAIAPEDARGYLERFIHGEIYKARPDVMAIVHNHTPTVISFGIGTVPLRPVFHQANFLLGGVPVWDYRDFGTADGALVHTPERGRALANTLSDRAVVLMKNHGVAVVGSSLPMSVGRSIMLEQNAQMQSDALARGDTVTYLELSGVNADGEFLRGWDLWKRQLVSR